MKKILFLLLFLTVSFYGMAQEFPVPMKGKIVSDYAGILTSAQTELLEQKLRSFNDTTSTQIAILTVKDLNGYASSEYAIRVAEQWGVGQEGKDNGVLILVKPKTERSRGEVFIAVGYGLEGAIPDVIAHRIVDRQILPAFQQGDIYGGLDMATTTLMKLASGEFTADSFPNEGNSPLGGVITLIIIVFFLALYVKKGKGGYTVGSEGGKTVSTFIPFFGIPGGRRHSGGNSFGGFSGGSSFGGFGGCSFGGGGAGGSW